MVLGSDRDTTPSSEGLRVCGPAPCSLPCDLPRRAPPSEVARSRSTSHTCHHHAGPRFRAGASGGPGPGEQPWRLPCRVGGQRHLWPEQPGRPRLCLSAGCTKGWWLTEHAGSPPRPGGRVAGCTRLLRALSSACRRPPVAASSPGRPAAQTPSGVWPRLLPARTVVSLDAGPSRRPRLSPTSSSGVCPSRGSRVRTSCNFCGDTDPPKSLSKPLLPHPQSGDSAAMRRAVARARRGRRRPSRGRAAFAAGTFAPSPPWRRVTQAPGSAVVFSTPRGPRPRCRGASLALDGTSAPGAAACGAVSTGARSPGWATGGDDPAHRSPPALWASRAGPCVALPEGTRLPSAGSPSRARSAPCPPKQVRNQTRLRSGSEMPALGNQARLLLNSLAAPRQRLRVDTGINPR